VPVSKEKKGGETIYEWVVINESGEIIPTKQDGFIEIFYNGFAIAIRDGRIFLLDTEGNEYHLPPDFNQSDVRIYPSAGGIFRVHFVRENRTGYFRVSIIENEI